MDLQRFEQILQELMPYGTQLIAVSKTKPAADVMKLYEAGQRHFGENKVQEMVGKYEELPKNIQWHLIGHLQTNKVKYIAPFVHLIHSVDSLKLLTEINKQAEKNHHTIDCLLQIYIANEDTKFGLSPIEAEQLLSSPEFEQLKNIRICGLMGMATNTENKAQIESEFASLRNVFEQLKQKFFSAQPYFKELSMGMSSDYALALKHGATMVRIGSILFGERNN
jgi:pyridoxal phosphate enzyme (YggS family)